MRVALDKASQGREVVSRRALTADVAVIDLVLESYRLERTRFGRSAVARA